MTGDFMFGLALGALAWAAGSFLFRVVMDAASNEYNPYEVE